MSLDTRIVKNQELGISYRESYEPLSKEEQKDLGIKAIRRKEVIKGPSDLFQNIHGNVQVYRFLTEDLFPSYQTWNHVLQGDGGSCSISGYREMKRFELEGQHMQEVLPLERMATAKPLYGFDGCPLFTIKGGGVDYKLPTRDCDVIKSSPLVYAMCASTSNEIWRDTKDLPIFIFGNRNPVFSDYVNTIQTHPEMREMLKLSGWTLDSQIILEDGEGRSYFEGFDKQKIKVPKLANPRQELCSQEQIEKAIPYLERIIREIPEISGKMCDGVTPYAVYHCEESLEWYRKVLNGEIKIGEDSRSIPKFDTTYLNLLMRGIPHEGNVKIPVVRHPDLRPLRWCHADSAVVERDGKTNVLFFETE